MIDWSALFKNHINSLQKSAEEILAAENHQNLVIFGGDEWFYYEDDCAVPFKNNHHFSHWCPASGHNHAIVIAHGKKPVLFYFLPQDFWHEHRPLKDEFWTPFFEIKVFSDAEKIVKELSKLSGVFHGPMEVESKKLKPIDNRTLSKLNWVRSYKTEYELACTTEANRIGAKGHVAARDVFLDGGSELDIHLAYLDAVRCRENDLPYESIIGLNENGAILHYSNKRDDIRKGTNLLIDAGANYLNYTSDITRTYATKGASRDFISLIQEMDQLQQKVVASIKAGNSFGVHHEYSHRLLAELLVQTKLLVGISVEEAYHKKLTSTFYPHGIGHMLGILVHDVAGRQLSPDGTKTNEDPATRLRNVRKVECGHLFTIEPGLYFIEMLLDEQRSSEDAGFFNWTMIEELKKFGGIRIEDNVYVEQDGVRNITRAFLPQ